VIIGGETDIRCSGSEYGLYRVQGSGNYRSLVYAEYFNLEFKGLEHLALEQENSDVEL